MIALDTNLLVYAHRQDSAFHKVALAAVERLVGGSAVWALPWPCVHEFIAIVTHPRIFKQPTPLAEAFATLRELLALPNLRVLSEGPGYFEVLDRLAATAKLSGPAVHDARIAALCLHHGVRELWSADRDFSRFRELVVNNPLA